MRTEKRRAAPMQRNEPQGNNPTNSLSVHFPPVKEEISCG